MAEFTPPPLWRDKSPAVMFENEIVRRDLYLLLSLFLSAESIAKSGRFEEFASDLQVSEISQRLITTAAIIRARDDHFNDEVADANDEWRGRIRLYGSQTCGTLQEDLRNQEVIPLTLREACNKIIHAREMRFDVEPHEPHSYINPIIYLYGRRFGKQWRVALDILAYVEAGKIYSEFD